MSSPIDQTKRALHDVYKGALRSIKTRELSDRSKQGSSPIDQNKGAVQWVGGLTGDTPFLKIISKNTVKNKKIEIGN